MSSINVFEHSLKANVEKVVYASSSSVYGNPLYTPVDEDHPKNPISPYAVSKLCGELYADYYFREYNLPITSLRFYTVYGPRGRPDMAIRMFFEDMLNIFNGKQVEKHYASDISLVLRPLPKVPMLICYWKPDDGLESDLTLFFDSTAHDNLPIESIYALGAGLVRMFEKVALRHGNV